MFCVTVFPNDLDPTHLGPDGSEFTTSICWGRVPQLPGNVPFTNIPYGWLYQVPHRRIYKKEPDFILGM